MCAPAPRRVPLQWHAQFGNYQLLERHHSFIQWLFPTRTRSMINTSVRPLQDEDVAQMKADPAIGGRLIKSYRMMLDFYVRVALRVLSRGVSS